MPSTQSPRLLFVHAHPDDEALGTGATIAYYAGRGADVRVVTCTLGEEGEVIGDRYALLAVDHADQLGGYRIAELTEALSILGAGQPMFLGGPGRWRDSGMAGTPPRRHTRFIDAGDAAVGELVDIIGRFRPHVVVTYDPEGGYGHPDHIHAHTVTTAAVTASAQSGWAVPKFYWNVLSTSAMTAALAALTEVPDGWHRPAPGDIYFGYPDDKIDAVIDGERPCGREGGGARRARHPGARRPRSANVRAVEQHGAADRRQASTTCWPRARRGRGTRAVGRPTCWPGSTLASRGRSA